LLLSTHCRNAAMALTLARGHAAVPQAYGFHETAPQQRLGRQFTAVPLTAVPPVDEAEALQRPDLAAAAVAGLAAALVGGQRRAVSRRRHIRRINVLTRASRPGSAIDVPPPKLQSFEDLGLSKEVVRGAAYALGLDPEMNPEAAELIMPAPVQAQAIPSTLAGKDMVIAAETGSGKTLAYLLPLVQQVKAWVDDRGMDYGIDFKYGEPLAIVVCATRELATQTGRVLKLIARSAKLRARIVHGGKGLWKQQARQLQDVVDILVATPDRLQKLRRENEVRFNDVRWVVVDEADFLLTQGFRDLYDILGDIDKEAKVTPEKMRYTLATASITKPLLKLFSADERWRRLQLLESKSLHKPTANCQHSFIKTRGADKVEMLISLIRPEIMGFVPSRQTLIFCNTVASCQSVFFQLTEAFANNQRDGGLANLIGRLHKDMPSEERENALRKFARTELRVLVCSDIAQRGLDLPNCAHVINFDHPLNSIDYLHRAGRTARFGAPGKVTSLVKKGDTYLARAIERSVHLGKPIDKLSGDKRDYMRGGALHSLLQHHQRMARKGQPKALRKPYDGSLR